MDNVLTLSNDPSFTDQFPSVPKNLRFSDSQSLYRFLDDNEERLTMIIDGKPEGFPGWAKNHLIIAFHDYSSGGLSNIYDSGEVAMVFNRDDETAYEIVNGILDHMIV